MCEGFLPKNDLWIPVDDVRARGLSENQFHDVLNRIEAEFSGDAAARGARLIVSRLWSNGTVNASASRFGNSWIITMYGGFARHPAISYDAFAAVACHELGHHLAGVPKYNGTWASAEGQADYYSTLKCL